MKIRKLEETLFKGLMIASLALVLATLAGIFLVILLRGASSLSLSMLIETPKGGYYLGEGGVSLMPSWVLFVWHSGHPCYRS